MNNNEMRESARDLLSCFFSECESEFRFLERKHDYRFICGLSEYKNGRQLIRPYYNQDMDGLFRAVARYEKDDHAIEIAYGDANLSIEGHAYFNQTHRLSLGEIITAAKKSEEWLEGNWLVTRCTTIRDTLGGMAKALQRNRKIFLESNPKLIGRALVMRGRRLEQAIREQFRKDMEQASMFAARAFLDKDYKKVIELFSPYESYLNPADAKKLALARKNIIAAL